MKCHFLLFFLVIFSGTGSFANPGAKTEEIKSIREVTTSLDSDTLLVFDIDNTLIEPVGHLGSDQWFYYLYKIYKMEGLGQQELEAKALKVWNDSQWVIQVKAVENETPEFIADKQKKGIKVIALTARTHDIAQRTLEQLKSVQIEFKKSSIYSEELTLTKEELHSPENAVMKEGVVFVGDHNNKGEVLVALLKKLNYSPKKVVYIDDKPKHVQNMEKALATRKLSYMGYRYGALDSKVKAYNDFTSEILDRDTAQIFLLGNLSASETVKIKKAQTSHPL